MFRDLIELKQKIDDNGLKTLKEVIVSSARPAIEIVSKSMKDENIALGQSKLGGKPDLPPNFDWPSNKDVPLIFIGQFNLVELASPSIPPPTPSRPTKQLSLWDMSTIPTVEPSYSSHTSDSSTSLPQSGILYFFYDEWAYNEAGGWHVEYRMDTSSLMRTTSLIVVTENGVKPRQLPSHRIEFVNKLMIPSGMYMRREDLHLFSHDMDIDYFEMYWHQGERPWHHFYGYPRNIQGKVERECVIISNKLQAEIVNRRVVYKDEDGHKVSSQQIEKMQSKWQFLFQIGSDNSLQTLWGDSGILYVCIPIDSVKDHNFKDCCVVMQCH